MGNQSVGTPRFYIDTVQYLKQIGFDFEEHFNNYYFSDMNENGWGGYTVPNQFGNTLLHTEHLFSLEPQQQKDPGWSGWTDGVTGYRMIDIPAFGKALQDEPHIGKYVAMLNHNMEFGNCYYEMVNQDVVPDGTWSNTVTSGAEIEILNSKRNYFDPGTSIVGIESDSNQFSPDNDRYCFDRIVFSDNYSTTTFAGQSGWENLRIGGISCGLYYDMPHSPDLKLTMETEFDGYDSITTLGGSTLTRTRYLGSPWWSDENNNKIEPFGVYPEWHQNTPISNFSKRNGRRSWNLKFSYLSDSDLFAPNPMAGAYLENSAFIDPDDTDMFNFGANVIDNWDMSIDVAADANPNSNSWGTNNNFSIQADGASVVTGGEMTVTTYTEAQYDAIFAAYGYPVSTSIGATSHNWCVQQYNVFGVGNWSSGNGTSAQGMLGAAHDFENDFTGWTVSSGCSIVTVNESKTCRITWTGGAYEKIARGDILEDGKEYKLVYDIIDSTSGSLMIENSPNAYLTTDVGIDHEVTWVSDRTTLIIKRNGATSSGDCKIDNVRLYKRVTDNVEIQRRKNAVYKLRFSAKKIGGDIESYFQVGCGYYPVFQQELTTEYQTYECLFSFNGYRDGDTISTGGGAWNASRANTAFLSSSSSRLVMGIYGQPDPLTFETSVKVDWITLEVSNYVDFKTNINTDSSFQSVVLNKVGNGQRFIFQPDNTANNPGDFAICVLDQDSLKVTQVAHNTYDCQMKIKEVW